MQKIVKIDPEAAKTARLWWGWHQFWGPRSDRCINAETLFNDTYHTHILTYAVLLQYILAFVL